VTYAHKKQNVSLIIQNKFAWKKITHSMGDKKRATVNFLCIYKSTKIEGSWNGISTFSEIVIFGENRFRIDFVSLKRIFCSIYLHFEDR
jgi:hypothetical protein